MLNFKKTEILLIILLILFISGFYIIQNPSTITKLFLIDSKAVQQSVALSITITGCEEEEINVTILGEAKPVISCNKEVIPKITELPANSQIKLRVYTNLTTPQGFTAPSTTLIEQVFNYINITLNTSLTTTATIYFNLTQSNLGSTDPDDIRLYKYTTLWNELTTTVIDGTSDPAEFSAETDSFSRFLIGKAAVGLPSVTLPLGAPSRGGRKIEKPVPRPKPIVITPIKKIIEKIIKLPAHLIRYKISYNVIYIVTISLIILIILLGFIHHYISKKKWNKK